MINEKSKFERMDRTGYIIINFTDTPNNKYIGIMGRKPKGYNQLIYTSFKGRGETRRKDGEWDFSSTYNI